jgi:hypothetical protein
MTVRGEERDCLLIDVKGFRLVVDPATVVRLRGWLARRKWRELGDIPRKINEGIGVKQEDCSSKAMEKSRTSRGRYYFR